MAAVADDQRAVHEAAGRRQQEQDDHRDFPGLAGAAERIAVDAIKGRRIDLFTGFSAASMNPRERYSR